MIRNAKRLFAVCVLVQGVVSASPFEELVGDGPGKVPGAVSMKWADGKVTAKCVGFADVAEKRPMTPDTIGWIASNTKAMACALVLTYVEEGKLELDEPISRYLPEWAGKRVPTLRQLMSHTAGMKFTADQLIDRYSASQLSRIGAKRGLFVSYGPGVRFSYSNWGICVAVACAEAVADEPWERLLQQRILDPLEMTDTTFFPSAEQLGRLAKGYYLTDDKVAEERTVEFFQYPYDLHTRYPEAGGGLFGSPMDMLKFFAMVANGGVGMNGKRVLKKETVALWFEKQTPDHVEKLYSFGANVSEDRCQMSHGGAWSTWGCANRSNGTARVFFVQKAGGESSGFNRFRSLLEKSATTSYAPPVRRADQQPAGSRSGFSK